MQQLEEGGPDPLVFVLNANLLAMVKLVNCEYGAPAVLLCRGRLGDLRRILWSTQLEVIDFKAMLNQ